MRGRMCTSWWYTSVILQNTLDSVLRGVIEGTRLRGTWRALVVTLDQTDRIAEDGVTIDIVPA